MKLDTQPQPQEVWSRNRIPTRIRSAALTMIDNQNMFCKPEGAMIQSHLKIGSSERREGGCVNRCVNEIRRPSSSFACLTSSLPV